MKKKRIIALLITIGLIISGCASAEKEYKFVDAETENIDHIHGAGYPNNEDVLFVATHNGLLKYEDNQWLEANSKKHDYMGFQAYEEGFYSSGHPEEGSDLKNPLGLIKSSDQGATLKKLAFYGETDFHYLAAGYSSNIIYAINQTPNSELDVGLYYTEGEGESWKRSSMKGFEEESIGGLSVHPTNKNILAVTGKEGVFLSEDKGNTFTHITDTELTTSIFLKEKVGLFASIEEGKIQLYEWNMESEQKTTFPTPTLDEGNPIMFISANPNNPKEWTIITYKNDIYTTKNNGQSWKEIVDGGNIEN
jgi:photosystem II stability/assembly factor-like uncharacterized protein